MLVMQYLIFTDFTGVVSDFVAFRSRAEDVKEAKRRRGAGSLRAECPRPLDSVGGQPGAV